ncbi:hypothetical protein FN846DRAFT_907807 [Sphaerosporella brunnea]|uniref:Uncharacterized protein n=1 Tax=Sphaerosporella brunnea TaxID=1250544 RepID=A0A5J5EV42_9PEZI|nr:hypothetical protein FN846DRAFT_907807 [Sphaerosporella brunnea]
MSDWQAFPWQNIKEGLEGRPASWYSEVFDLAFHNLDKKRVANLWKKQLEKPAKKEKGREHDDE